MNTAKGREELQKLFETAKTAMGNSWQESLLVNAQRVSAPLVIRMLKQIGLDENTTEPFCLVDNGCGAGVVAAELQRLIQPDAIKESSVLCGDLPETMVGLVKQRIENEGW